MLRSSALFPLFVVLTGCATTPGEAARPKELTYADAVNGESATGKDGKCLQPGEFADTLVVDLNPADRLELETAMKDGVIAVKYDCSGLRLIKDCRASGGYGFKGATTKEQVISLESADEVRANLPSIGGALAVDLSAEMKSGATLDVGLAMVGKLKSTRLAVGSEDLEGSCKDATHFVRGATLGAFAMAQGTKGEVKAAARIFDAGGSTSSLARRKVQQKDGDVKACRSSSSRATEPPEQCAALLRLELKQIVPGKTPEAPSLVDARQCPQGLVFDGGKCAVAAGAATRMCKTGDETDCRAQCAAGHTESCAYLGSMLMERGDLASAAPFFDKGCQGGNLLACHNLGYAYYEGAGVPKDFNLAKKWFSHVCDSEEPIGCAGLALLYDEGKGVPQDTAESIRLYTLACNGGEMLYGCPLLGRFYQQGKGVAKDLERARELYQRACATGSPNGCLLLKHLPPQ